MGQKNDTEDKFNVLIVDDDIELCELMALFMQISNQFKHIVTASSAMNASQKLQNQDFDLFIIDHEMPVKKGLNLIESITQSPKYAGAKIILISGHLKRHDVLFATSLKVKNILVKPFTFTKLLRLVYQVLNLDVGKIEEIEAVLRVPLDDFSSK